MLANTSLSGPIRAVAGLMRPELPQAHPCRFADRVRLYAGLDEKLHSRTRFFGAAALINATLVELCSLPCLGRWRFAVDYFGLIGTALEALNVKWARRIEDGEVGTATSDLDSSLVTLEQLEVERLLQQHQSQDLHRRAIEQINWLLQWGHSLTRPLRHCPSISVFRPALAEVRARLGRPVDFALLDDRIGIGHTLTRSMRELGSFAAIGVESGRVFTFPDLPSRSQHGTSAGDR